MVAVTHGTTLISDKRLPGGCECVSGRCWHKCMDQLRFAREIARGCGSRRYVSSLFDRLAGRGLDGNTPASSDTLVDRLASNHLCQQALDALIDPFQAFFSVANSRGVWLRKAITLQWGRRRLSRYAGCSMRSAPACWPWLWPVCCDASLGQRSEAMLRS